MNAILRPVFLEGHVQVYIDDILVYTSTKEEHQALVRRVLQILKENRLYLKPEKCEFKKDHVDYLGVVVSANGVAMDHEKIKAIADWPTPKKLVHVQEFIGFLNFYRRFIEGFSRIARPLHDLTKKGATFTWTTECQKAFGELKGRVTSAPILAMARDEGQMRIKADACQTATGGVLSQEQDGIFRPIAYFSQSLNETERNYDIYDRELLGVMKALKEWRHYVIGRKLEIWTDHKNLEYFMEKRDLNRRQARWSAELADYEYTLHYKTGKSMIKADVLSRRPDLTEGVENDNKQIQLLPAFQKIAGTILGTQGDVFVQEIKNGRGELQPTEVTTVENHHDGLHRPLTGKPRKQHDPQRRRPTLETTIFTPLPRQHNRGRSSTAIPEGNLAPRGTTQTGHTIRGRLHQRVIQTLTNNRSPVDSLPSPDGWTDGKSESVYLRAFINHHQDNWEDWLPAATFSWNSKPGPTGRSPFEATKGYQPTMGMEPSQKGKELAGDFEAEMAGVFKETEAALKMAAEDMKRFYVRGDDQCSPYGHN